MRESSGPIVLLDFQALYIALTGVKRDSNNRYPLRDPALLPTVEYMRQAGITQARERGIDMVVTNSDGDHGRRAYLLGRMTDTAPESILRNAGEEVIESGFASLVAGVREIIVDPGEAVVRARLANKSGQLEPECVKAIGRFYGNQRNYRYSDGSIRRHGPERSGRGRGYSGGGGGRGGGRRR